MQDELKRPVTDVLRYRKDLQEKIAKTISDLPGEHQLSTRSIAVGDARERLNSFIHRHGSGENDLSAVRKQELLSLKSNLEQKKEEMSELADFDKQLKKEIESLKKELESLSIPSSIDDLLMINGDIAKVNEEIAALHSALTEQNALATSVTSADELTAKRDELLADAALGKDVKKPLADVQAKLAAAEKQAEKGIDAEQAALVLQSRIEIAKEKLSELAVARKEVLAGVIAEHGRSIQAECQDISAALALSLTRLFAVDELLDLIAPGQGGRFVTVDLRATKIVSTTGGVIFSGYDVDRVTAADKEYAHLNELTGGALFSSSGL